MKICVIGCAAAGSLFAAHLAKAGEAEACASDVWRQHTDAIRTNGLILSGAADFTARLHATSDAKELPGCDYGIAMPDARGAQWTKLIFNAATNPVGALTLLHHGAATRFQPTNQLFNDLILEGEAVANKLGIVLHGDPRQLVQKGATAPGKHKASMLQDVLAKRQTEVDFMNGAIVQWGKKVGVPTPLNKALWELIKGLECSWSDPA